MLCINCKCDYFASGILFLKCTFSLTTTSKNENAYYINMICGFREVLYHIFINLSFVYYKTVRFVAKILCKLLQKALNFRSKLVWVQFRRLKTNQFVIACADYETISNWNNMVTPEIKSLIYLDFLLIWFCWMHAGKLLLENLITHVNYVLNSIINNDYRDLSVIWTFTHNFPLLRYFNNI